MDLTICCDLVNKQPMNPNWWPIYGWDFKHPQKKWLNVQRTSMNHLCSKVFPNPVQFARCCKMLQDVARFKARSSMTFWGKPDVKPQCFMIFGWEPSKKLLRFLSALVFLGASQHWPSVDPRSVAPHLFGKSGGSEIQRKHVLMIVLTNVY